MKPESLSICNRVLHCVERGLALLAGNRPEIPRRRPVRQDGAPDPAGDRRQGQTMVEYLIVAAMLVGPMAMMGVFLYVYRKNAGRVLDLVGSEYP
jgi:hypothetical protein